MLARIIFLAMTITVALIGTANAANGNEAEEFFAGLSVILWVTYFIPRLVRAATAISSRSLCSMFFLAGRSWGGLSH